MADRLSTEQVSELKTVIGAAATGSLDEVIGALRKAAPSGFSAGDLDSIADAVSLMLKPRDPDFAWPAGKNRGLFFVFEGLDRSGKSTQSKRLFKHLEQQGPAKWMCFPNRATPSGILIDLYLRKLIELSDEAIHQLFSANRWEIAQNLVDDLCSGTSIVCDRYAFSGVAYSVAKGLDFDWCQSPDRGLPTPDGIFFLHIDEKVGASRSNFGDERYENTHMQSQVRQEFKRPELRKGVAWHDVDGARDIDVIHSEIRAAAEEARRQDQENESRRIPQLWLEAEAPGPQAKKARIDPVP